MKKFLAVLLFANASSAAATGACPAEVVSNSGSNITTIAELYTSEGCDSCPPADKWLSRLQATPSKNQPVIPLAFHVDYWDYIGWRDPYSQARFAVRQRAMVQAAGKRTVYTPQVFVNSRDVGPWSNQNAFQNAVNTIAARPATVSIRLTSRVETPSTLNAHLTVEAAAGTAKRDLSVFVALSERNLVSNVTAGENRGVTLRHDHVVRRLLGPLALGESAEIVQAMVLSPEWKRADLSAVAFVQNSRTGEILQAVAHRLCE